jgi:hypothetical protein
MALFDASAICVVERGERPLLTPADLPERSLYRLLAPEVARTQSAGVAATALGDRRFLICAPHDIYPLRSELRASLLCGLDYDVVTPTHQPLALRDEDTRKMVRDDVSSVNTGLYPAWPSDPLTAEFCIISAPALRQRLELSDGGEILTGQLLEHSRVFRSPSRLLRLSPNSKAAVTTED